MFTLYPWGLEFIKSLDLCDSVHSFKDPTLRLVGFNTGWMDEFYGFFLGERGREIERGGAERERERQRNRQRDR